MHRSQPVHEAVLGVVKIVYLLSCCFFFLFVSFLPFTSIANRDCIGIVAAGKFAKMLDYPFNEPFWGFSKWQPFPIDFSCCPLNEIKRLPHPKGKSLSRVEAILLDNGTAAFSLSLTRCNEALAVRSSRTTQL